MLSLCGFALENVYMDYASTYFQVYMGGQLQVAIHPLVIESATLYTMIDQT